MGLFKWLKRSEVDVSPLSLSTKKRQEKLPAKKKSIHETRNDSYLKALSNFNKWRQMHLKKTSLKKNTRKLNFKEDNADNFSSAEYVYSSHQHYEEIDSVNKGSLLAAQDTCDQNFTNTVESLDNNIYSYAKCENSPSNSKYFSTACDEDYSKSYSLKKNAPIYTNLFSTEKKLLNICEDENFTCREKQEQSTLLPKHLRNITTTDLDKSPKLPFYNSNIDTTNKLDLVAKFKTYEPHEAINEYIQSDLIICPSEQIKSTKDTFIDITANYCLSSGEIDAIQISYVYTKQRECHEIFLNFETLRKLRHPNIVLLMGITTGRDFLLEALILEPVQCTLYTTIHEQKNIISLENCHRYAVDITNAIIYLHRRGFIHSNVCSRNILLKSNGKAAKLFGFELCICETTCNLSQLPLPMHINYRNERTQHFYQAPELISNIKKVVVPLRQSDVYGICITLWEMLNLLVPYNQYSYEELSKIFSLKTRNLLVYNEERCFAFKRILQMGLDVHPKYRIPNAVTLNNMLRHVCLLNDSNSCNCAQKNVKKDQICTRDMCMESQDGCDYQQYADTSRPCNVNKNRNNLTNRVIPRNKFRKLSTEQNFTTILESTSRDINTVVVGSSSKETCNEISHKYQDYAEDSYARPTKMYNVNIRIQQSWSKRTLDVMPKMSNVKQKIHKFESISSQNMMSVHTSGLTKLRYRVLWYYCCRY